MWWWMESIPSEQLLAAVSSRRTYWNGRVVRTSTVGLLAVDRATTVGMAAGLAVGAALVDYGISRGDLLLMGAVTGLGVGVLQALVLARHGISNAFWWAVANPPALALGWFVTSYVITRNVDERFTNFGASGAVVFGLLTWPVLAFFLHCTRREAPVA
jgi:hypothetical protein